MKKLNVPLHLQTAESIDCGPVCAQMVLEYFGIKRQLPYLKDKLNYDEKGTSAYDNGSLLLDEGLKVTAVTAHPMLFPPDLVKSSISKDDILKIIKTKAKKVSRHRSVLKTMEIFLKKGGKMQIEIPTGKHIYKAINTNQPAIALLYGGAVGSNEGGFHFVVVTGYDDKYVFVNNPLPESKKKGKYPLEQFLYALHTSTTSDIDNGTLLMVSR